MGSDGKLNRIPKVELAAIRPGNRKFHQVLEVCFKFQKILYQLQNSNESTS